MKARAQWREEVRQWARGIMRAGMNVKTEYYQNDPFDTSDADWGFYYPFDIVRRGYTRWRASDFARMPTPEEIMNCDERWEGDLNRMSRIVRFHTEADPITGLVGGIHG